MKLRDYQHRAVKHLHDNPRAGLFLDMGLGKTASTLSALTPDHFPVLVVAPKRVAETVWGPERDLWRPDLRISVVAGTPTQRRHALMKFAHVYVIGRDNIADVTGRKYRTVVLDELSGFKDRGSKRWKVTKKITDAADYVYGLTGTPAPNGYMGLWAQLYLLDSGKRLGRTITSYRQQYFTEGARLPNGVVTRWDLLPGAKEKIQRRIADICLSMDNDGLVDLPPVTRNRVVVTLPPEARRMHDELKADMVTDLDVLGVPIAAPSASLVAGKQSQITAGFVYDEEGRTHWLHTKKFEALTEIVEGTGSPVLVFYRYVAERDEILRRFPEASTMDEPDVVARWNAGKVPLLLAHPQSAGHGLNLQHGGSTCVWTSLTWDLEEWEQGNARLARSGQKHPVVIHTIVAPDSIDEAMEIRLRTKQSVQDALLAYLRGTD